MTWLYRLQQRFSITQTESLVLLVLVMLFNVGLVARYLQRRPRPIPPETYRAGDHLFEQGAALPAADTLKAEETNRTPPASHDASSGPVNLNTASSAQLQRLSGVGPKTAASIRAYRERRGGFRRKQELMRVSGIGPKTLQRLREHIAVH